MTTPAPPLPEAPEGTARGIAPALAHVDAWIFDLDNTLYPASTRLFAQIDARMTDFIARLTGLPHGDAHVLQKRYFFDHGTTLAGLMVEHDIDPYDFLDYVHDIEMDVLEENAPLAAAISRLPGRKIVFTNGDAPYAGRVLARLGLAATFEAIHDIHAMDLAPKPAPSAYEGLCRRFAIDPARALFADDMARNLAPAKALGMTTVWVDNGSEQAPGDDERAHIDYRVADVTHWLQTLVEDMA